MAVCEALDLQNGPLGTDDHGVGGARGLGQTKLLANALLPKRKADTPPSLAEFLRDGQRIGTALLGGDDKKHLHESIRSEGCFFTGLGRRTLSEEFQQDGVTDTESDGGQIHRTITEIGKKPVVTTTPGNGSQSPVKGKGLENHPGVIGKSPHHTKVGAHISAKSAGFEIGKERSERGNLGTGDELL